MRLHTKVDVKYDYRYSTANKYYKKEGHKQRSSTQYLKLYTEDSPPFTRSATGIQIIIKLLHDTSIANRNATSSVCI
jgi:hypothetical protein